MQTLAQQDGSFFRRCKSQSGSFEQRYLQALHVQRLRNHRDTIYYWVAACVSPKQQIRSSWSPSTIIVSPQFTYAPLLNTGKETKAKQLRNQIRPREGHILQMPTQREKKSCAANCLNVFFVTHSHPPRATPSPRRAGGGAQGRLSSQQQ